MKPKVSIIVPVYNTDKFVGICLRSLLAQSYKNIEIICINDGSTDNSKKEVEKFLFDERVFLINTPNRGVSAARNVGIENSQGDYIMFVDSDDFLKTNTVETCVRYICKSKCDILCFGIIIYKNNSIQEYRKDFNINSDIPLREHLCLHWNAAGKIFSTKFIKTNNVKFV